MCRSIVPLHNIEPAATEDEARAAALQFVRKVSGYQKPSKANEAAFERAVDDIAAATWRLVGELRTSAAPRARTGSLARVYVTADSTRAPSPAPS
ncbi:MAG TPA: DUF2277 domain-containing protein [Gaiellaceae bacterium]|nr:DUF2277 domain-containing protein [Gaiellaceae bacterium]